MASTAIFALRTAHRRGAPDALSGGMEHLARAARAVALSGMLMLALAGSAAAEGKHVTSRAVQTGTASWYGAFHDGRKTASGEIYDMHRMTAAHRSLPLGTRVKVTNLKNGRSMEVRVNDRGPYVRGRILDLSYA